MNHDRSIGFTVKALSNDIKRFIDRNAKRHNHFTGMHHGIMHFIMKRTPNEDTFQKDIEKEFNIRRSTATGILQLMEKNGMIHRESVPYDARLKKIVMTDKSYEYQLEWIEGVKDLEETMAKDVSEEELDIFFKVIDKISKNIS